MKDRCMCVCKCSDEATTSDEGVPVCDECRSYYVTDDGEVVCSRMQGLAMCRHCGERIEWGQIQTGRSPGMPSIIMGTCGCREWKQTERGGEWELAELPEEQEEIDGE